MSEPLHKRPAPQVPRHGVEGLEEELRQWGVRLTELEHDGCRWQVGRDGEGNALFCNATRKKGSSWCAPHWKQATAAGSTP